MIINLELTHELIFLTLQMKKSILEWWNDLHLTLKREESRVSRIQCLSDSKTDLSLRAKIKSLNHNSILFVIACVILAEHCFINIEPSLFFCLFLQKPLLSCCYSVAKSCLTLWDPMDCNLPSFPVLYYLLEFGQTHAHWVSDAFQPFFIFCWQNHTKHLNWKVAHFSMLCWFICGSCFLGLVMHSCVGWKGRG